MVRYRTAQVCEKGHVLVYSMESHSDLASPFCPQCGSPTVTHCRRCEEPIRGAYDEFGTVPYPERYTPPAFCHQCAAQHPWTESALGAARELAEELDLTESDKSQLKESIGALVEDTPQTQVASRRVKRVLAKIGAEAGKGMRDILVSVISETAKKIIWPQGPP